VALAHFPPDVRRNNAAASILPQYLTNIAAIRYYCFGTAGLSDWASGPGQNRRCWSVVLAHRPRLGHTRSRPTGELVPSDAARGEAPDPRRSRGLQERPDVARRVATAHSGGEGVAAVSPRRWTGTPPPIPY